MGLKKFGKAGYRINPQTLALERVERDVRYWLRRGGWNILSGMCMGILFFFLYFAFFPSPKERQLQMEQQNLEAQLKVLHQQVNQMQIVQSDMSQRDDNLYRVLLGAEPIPLSVRMGATQKISYYEEISRMTNSQLAAELTMKVDMLEKELYVQAKSFEDLVELTKTQEVRMENIPAIQPVLNKDLKHVASGFGWRVDPVYHTKRFHQGMDFTAQVGTDIYATGNAKVSFAGWRQGYGNTIMLDHGFGYETLYAHCHKILVHQGQSVKRGDVIGLVGNTGKSTGSHVHYEVHCQGTPVDPRNFYFYDLSPEEYDQMVQLSNNFGNMLD